MLFERSSERSVAWKVLRLKSKGNGKVSNEGHLRPLRAQVKVRHAQT